MRNAKRMDLRLVLLSVILVAHVYVVIAQSGRKSPPPSPTLTEKSEAEFKPDPNRNEYQLVFTKVLAEENFNGPWRSREKRLELYATTFSDELTRMSAQGYRLSSIAFSPRVAVMRRDDHQYEYALIQMASRSRMFPNDPKFDATYDPWARKGFRVADYVVLDDSCNVNIWDSTNNVYDGAVDCTYASLVILERQRNSVMPAHSYQIVHVRPTLSKEKLQTGLREELDDARKSKLYPTHMLTKFQLLTQSPFGTEDVIGEEYETEIVSGELKKINVLAQQGYRLILRPLLLSAAVMHRAKGTTVPTSYVWISEKRLEEEIRRLQQQGMIYRMNYGCESRSPMIFEQPSVVDDKHREYRVVRIELKEKSDANRTVEYELLPGTTAAIEELNRLAKLGFEVRDFLGCYSGNRTSGLKILLERVSSKDERR